MAELTARAQAGQMPVPAVLANGKPVSYGVPRYVRGDDGGGLVQECGSSHLPERLCG